MRHLQGMAILAIAISAPACAPDAADQDEEDVGEVAQAASYTFAAGGSGWHEDTLTGTFYNSLTVTGIQGGTFKVGGVGLFQSLQFVPATPAAIQMCEASYAKFFTYRYLNGAWVQWLAPQTVFATATVQGSQITNCSARFQSGWTTFGGSTQLNITTYAYSADPDDAPSSGMELATTLRASSVDRL